LKQIGERRAAPEKTESRATDSTLRQSDVARVAAFPRIEW
jgi:hypothetical protein